MVRQNIIQWIECIKYSFYLKYQTADDKFFVSRTILTPEHIDDTATTCDDPDDPTTAVPVSPAKTKEGGDSYQSKQRLDESWVMTHAKQVIVVTAFSMSNLLVFH